MPFLLCSLFTLQQHPIFSVNCSDLSFSRESFFYTTRCAHWGKSPKRSVTSPKLVNSCWKEVFRTPLAHTGCLPKTSHCRAEKKSQKDRLTQSRHSSLRSVFMGDNSKLLFFTEAEVLGTKFKGSKACCWILGMLMTIRWTWGRWRLRRNSVERNNIVCIFYTPESYALKCKNGITRDCKIKFENWGITKSRVPTQPNTVYSVTCAHMYWINNMPLMTYVDSTPHTRQQSMIHFVKTSFPYSISSTFMNY